uniref:Putative triabin-like lipocalin 4a lipocalin n=1 Tax=Panstrongylus lignarius TaxID=156445 RepID=A0A224XKL4_9HEMI
MKTVLLLLTILGATTLAFTVTLEKLVCLNVPAKEKFEPKKYFHGRWYLTNLQKASTSPTDVCQESLSEVLENGTISHKIYAYSDKKTPEFVVLDCKSSLSEVKDDLGKVPLHCKVTNNDKVWEFDMDGTIVETDYDHFALFYVCGKTENQEVLGNMLVLSRDKDVEPKDPRIADTLKKLGLDLSTFALRKNAHCKKHPSVLSS